MKVEVLACNDGLEAKLAIQDFDRVEWRSRFRDKEDLRGLLLEAGLVPERVEESAIESIFQLLNDDNRDAPELAVHLNEVQSLIVASGIPPVNEEAEGLMFHKAYLSEREEVEGLERRLRETAFEEVRKAVDPGCLVDSGQVILSLMSVQEGRAGIDVFGKSLPFRPYTYSLPKVGPGVLRLEKKWIAKGAGVLVLADNTLKVLGSRGFLPGRVHVSEDNLEARLILEEEQAGILKDVDGSLESIKAEMARMGLRPIQDENALQSGLKAFCMEGRGRNILLLRGTPPQHGKNGSLQLLVNAEPDLPDPEAVEKMDFKAFSFFRSVRKGDMLARVLPPDPGVGGMDVYGNILLPRPGSPFVVTPRMNTDWALTDPSIIMASRDGRLSMDDGVPVVVDTLKIEEDVSFRTGNLVFPGSVEVAGNVLDKFAIEAKGDIGIGGVVENAMVVSEGAILIKGGVIGGGQGLIKSKLSSVTIGFIRNQRIESHSNIVVFNEVLNAQLLARKAILMKSTYHSVMGGHLTAFECIEVFNAGNEAGTKTILEVGKDFEVEAELLRKQEVLKSVRADLEYLDKKRIQLERIVRWEAGKNSENRLLEQRVKGVVKLLEKVRTSLIDNLNALEAKLYNPIGCHITVSGTAFPGTVLKYRDKVIPISEPMLKMRWVFKPN